MSLYPTYGDRYGDGDGVIVDKNPWKYMAVLESKYKVKTSSIGEAKVYLEADAGKLLYGDSSYTWTMISDSYVKEAINNVKKRLN